MKVVRRTKAAPAHALPEHPNALGAYYDRTPEGSACVGAVFGIIGSVLLVAIIVGLVWAVTTAW